MATLALSGGSLQRVKSLLKQWEATHGRKATPDVTRAIMEAELSNASKGANEAARLEQNQERLDFTKEQTLNQQEQQKKASQIQGGVQTALVAKELGAGKAIGAAGEFLGIGSGTSAATAAPTIGGGAASVAPGAAAVPGTGAPALAGVTGEAAAGVGTGATAATGGTTAAGGEAAGGSTAGATGAGIAAAIIIDSAIARSKNGGFKDARERQEANRLGFRFGGISPGAAATLQDAGILTFDQLADKHLGSNFEGLESDVMDFVDTIGGSLSDDVSDFFNDIGF